MKREQFTILNTEYSSGSGGGSIIAGRSSNSGFQLQVNELFQVNAFSIC